jgi:hypothetical protein
MLKGMALRASSRAPHVEQFRGAGRVPGMLASVDGWTRVRRRVKLSVGFLVELRVTFRLLFWQSF